MRKEIGEAAGKVWTYLNDNGEVTTPTLLKRVGLPRDVAHRAIGWLAREGKVQIDSADGVEKLRLC
jgi:hypothetical protein